MKTLILSMSLPFLLPFAWAQTESKPLELPQLPSEPAAGKSKTRTSMSCKTPTGATYKATDPGFDSCVANSVPSHDSSRAGQSPENQGTSNFEVKFGE